MNRQEMKSFRRQLRSNGTPAEGGLWKLLKAKRINGLQFRRQYSVGNHILDFYCPALKLAIELDGNYHYYGATPEYDMERDEELLYNFGIYTLRFENIIVFQQPQAIINSILEFQKRVTSRSTPPAPSNLRGGVSYSAYGAGDTDGNHDISSAGDTGGNHDISSTGDTGGNNDILSI